MGGEQNALERNRRRAGKAPESVGDVGVNGDPSNPQARRLARQRPARERKKAGIVELLQPEAAAFLAPQSRAFQRDELAERKRWGRCNLGVALANLLLVEVE